jgi:hypothetical protein
MNDMRIRERAREGECRVRVESEFIEGRRSKTVKVREKQREKERQR